LELFDRLWVGAHLPLVLLSQYLYHIGSQPLHISTFTLDEFEHALRHSQPDPPCPLLAEVHSTLIYNLRTVTFQRHSALVSLLRLKDELGEEGRPTEQFGVSIDDLSAAMADVGNNWERVPLRHTEGREGWEEALLGCLKDVCLFFFYSTDTY
jgi:bromodomain adjacent to zinc finger domain protein 1A